MRSKIVIFTIAMLAYVCAGKLGLMFSIPPGFASAVWPASGVALALALRFPVWPSVLGTACGSFIINLSIATAQFTAISMQSVMIAQGIAIAALLQTLAGYFLFRHYIRDIPNLVEPTKQMHFLLQVSLLGCLTSCTLSSTTLLLSGAIQPNAFIFTWLTWWLGDALGVLFFTPFLLTLLCQRSCKTDPQTLIEK